MRILVAIISSNTHQVYSQNKEVLQTQSLPEGFDRVFLEYSEEVKEITLSGETLLLPGVESGVGIIHKTLDGMEYLFQKTHYDFIIRTNLSTYWRFDLLAQYFAKEKKEGHYAGYIGYAGGSGFVSGAGILISNDVAQMLINNKEKLYERLWTDDINIGRFLGTCKISIIPHMRDDIYSLADFEKMKDKIITGPRGRMQFRLKCKGTRTDEPELIRRVMALFASPKIELASPLQK